jgi:hypothetical protein
VIAADYLWIPHQYLGSDLQGALSVANIVSGSVVTADRTAECDLVCNEVVATVTETIQTGGALSPGRWCHGIVADR